MQLDEARHREHDKYVRAYASGRYGMGPRRMVRARKDLESLPTRGSYLDVGCGRGEMLQHAAELGYHPVKGTEIVPKLIDEKQIVRAEVHALPFADNSFDVVSMFDVIEHLIPGDDEQACKELVRVAKYHIIIAANNRLSTLMPNKGGKPGGEVLHINRRSYDEWDELFHQWFSLHSVMWIKDGERFSETWRIDL